MPNADDRYTEQLDEMFALCKMQAQVDGAFPDFLLRKLFDGAFDLCKEMIGYSPPLEIEESIGCIDNCGNFTLNHQPTSEVRIYEGYSLIMTLRPDLRRCRCDPALCCACGPLKAKYWIGNTDPCVLFTPRFEQAVARLFAYMLEHRGDDATSDNAILRKSGAFTFLAPDLTYVA